jgi:hypothetical protein
MNYEYFRKEHSGSDAPASERAKLTVIDSMLHAMEARHLGDYSMRNKS